jgi:hypothetical protein
LLGIFVGWAGCGLSAADICASSLWAVDFCLGFAVGADFVAAAVEVSY